MTQLKSKVPFQVGNITNHAGVLIGYGVWRMSDVGGGSYVAQTGATGPNGLRAMQDEAERLNRRDKHDVQPRREHKRTDAIWKGVRCAPVGDKQWAAYIGREHLGPARDTMAQAVADKFAL